MRVLAIITLALLLAGCSGDRIKHGMNMRLSTAAKLVPFSDPYLLKNPASFG
jgi:hypothetical protein